MVACINPSHFCSDHTVNTLRYADRLNEREKLQLNFDINLDIDEFETVSNEQGRPQVQHYHPNSDDRQDDHKPHKLNQFKKKSQPMEELNEDLNNFEDNYE